MKGNNASHIHRLTLGEIKKISGGCGATFTPGCPFCIARSQLPCTCLPSHEKISGAYTKNECYNACCTLNVSLFQFNGILESCVLQWKAYQPPKTNYRTTTDSCTIS